MTYCETSPLLNAAQLKIQGREINEAIGWSRGWLANFRFLGLCFADPQLTGLSHLLAQVEEHNNLVSAIEMDIRKAATKERTLLNDLYAVVKTFSQTKEEIMQAIAHYGAQTNDNSSEHAVANVQLSDEADETGGVYSWLIRKSRSLRTQVQGLVDSLAG